VGRLKTSEVPTQKRIKENEMGPRIITKNKNKFKNRLLENTLCFYSSLILPYFFALKEILSV